MKTRSWVIVVAIGMLLTPGLGAREVRAQGTPSCGGSMCLNSCNTYCASKNKTCDVSSVHVTCGECGPGTCSFLCTSGGSGQNVDCTCGNCGGSPIFRKEETQAKPQQPAAPAKPAARQKPATADKPATPDRPKQEPKPEGGSSSKQTGSPSQSPAKPGASCP